MNTFIAFMGAAAATAFALTFAGAPEAAQAGETTRVSVNSTGVEGNFDSVQPAISATGRFVAFTSFADNLVPGDTNGTGDVFVHDRRTGETTRVSVDSFGVGGGGIQPAISATGRFVTFTSLVDNLVPGDTNGAADVFVHNRKTGETTRVSVDSTGVEGNSLSSRPAISATGRFVAFLSEADNLVPGDTNGMTDVFVHDRRTGETTRVNVDSFGVQGNNASIELPAISRTGRFVAFRSFADNLVPGDTNDDPDIFVHDRKTGETTRVSVDSFGVEGNSFTNRPAISATGRFVAFGSRADNLVVGDTNDASDVVVHDRKTGETTRVSVDSLGVEGNSFSFASAISATGRFVTFSSLADNLVPGDTNDALDSFVHDRRTGETTRVSVDSFGVEGNDDIFGFGSGLIKNAISATGRFVAFSSFADNLVPDDTNGAADVFVHDRK